MIILLVLSIIKLQFLTKTDSILILNSFTEMNLISIYIIQLATNQIKLKISDWSVSL